VDRSPVNYEWTGRIRFVFHPGAALSPNRFWPAVDVGTFPNAENAAVGDLDGDGILVAEEMIRLNEEKQKEMKNFLAWLEAELRVQPDKAGNTGIEALTGKATLRNYLGDSEKGEPELPFEDLWKILHKNKSRIGRKLTTSSWPSCERPMSGAWRSSDPSKDAFA